MDIAIGILLVLVVAFLSYRLFQKNKQLVRYKDIADIESEKASLQKENNKLKAENETLKEQGRGIRSVIGRLKSDLSDLEDEQSLQEFGVYKPKYDFGSSELYKDRLKTVRESQKEMIRNKKAIIWKAQWHVEGSKAKGKAMMNQQTKLMLQAFNGACDALILKVKYNNVERIRAQIHKAYDRINKLGKAQSSSINPMYLSLKIDEVRLVHEYQEKREAEKEEQRQIREEMREEQRAQKEMEKAKREAEKEEQRYQKALDKARQEMQKATGDKQTKLQEEIEKLNKMLEEAHSNKERAISRAQMTRSGHVYIISNIGSFGDGVYKIGMTRRLEPMDRVKELGDASVPFLFDVHAMIYSDDAPNLESHLHKIFDDRRVNRVNYRKEFFRVSLDEIVRIVKEQTDGEIEFTMKAEAEDYRKTKALIAEANKTDPIEKSEALYASVLDG